MPFVDFTTSDRLGEYTFSGCTTSDMVEGNTFGCFYNYIYAGRVHLWLVLQPVICWEGTHLAGFRTRDMLGGYTFGWFNIYTTYDMLGRYTFG